MGKERKIDMVILGLLSHEKLTGYDIKNRIDKSIKLFWKGSYGSIYPSLNAMQKEGLVLKQVSKSDPREKIYYSITAHGREYLLDWLNDKKATNDLKYESLLKLFFGGVANSEVTIANIEAFEKQINEDLELLYTHAQNLSSSINEDYDHLCFYLTVTFGIESYETYIRWAKKAKSMIKDYGKQL